MRLLITGANGLIGRRLVELACDRGHAVTSAILPATSEAGLDGTRVVTLPSDDGALGRILEGHDVVVNLAGNMRGRALERYTAANVEFPRRLMESLGRLPSPPRVLHVSSVAAVGPSPDGIPLGEDAPCLPIGTYGITKRGGEVAVLEHGGRVPVLVIRPPSIYGPEDTCFLDLFRWARRGVFPKLCTAGKRFNLLFRDDLARALLDLAVREPHAAGLLHVGSGEVHTDEDLAAALERAAGRPLHRLFLGRWAVHALAWLTGLKETITGEPQLLSASKVGEMSQPYWVHDFSRFYAIDPGRAFKPLALGVGETWDWYASRRWL